MIRRRAPEPPDTDIEDVLRAWLDESRVPLSEVALDAALARTRVMPARRPRSRLDEGRPLVAAVIALVSILGGVGVLVSLPPATRPAPVTAATAGPVDVQPPIDVEDSPLAGIWYRAGRSGGAPGVGVLRLSSFASLQGWRDAYFGLSGATVVGDVLDIPPLPGGACADQGAAYRWSADGVRAVLVPADDPCVARQAVMTGSWHRLEPGMSLADRFQFPFVYRTPDGRPMLEVGSKMHALADPHVDAVRGFGIWVVEDAFADPCAGAGSVTPAPGPDGLIAHLQSLDALQVSPPEATTIDGRLGTSLRFERLPGVCANDHLRLWRDSSAPLADGNIWFSLPVGGRADAILLEMDGATIALVAWAPDGEAPATSAIRDLIASIDFLEARAD